MLIISKSTYDRNLYIKEISSESVWIFQFELTVFQTKSASFFSLTSKSYFPLTKICLIMKSDTGIYPEICKYHIKNFVDWLANQIGSLTSKVNIQTDMGTK